MATQYCLRCNLPIRRDCDCICTSPNLRIYDPNEPDYLKPSTADQPLLWLTLFMERREVYRFRGDFFAYALSNPNKVIQINEFENYFDLKHEVHGAPEPYIRHHYSECLYSIVKGQVEKSISLIKVALNTSDYMKGKHLIYRCIRVYDDIMHNMKKIEKPSDTYDALQNAFDDLNTFLENEKSYYISAKATSEIVIPQYLSDDDLNEELTRIGKLRNEFWEKIPMTVVIAHFVKLTKDKNKKGVQYLTGAQLISFLKKGFLNDSKQESQLINCPYGDKGYVISLFYDFYDIALSSYWHPQRKDPFIDLISNCFSNWDTKTIGYSFKPKITKRKWKNL